MCIGDGKVSNRDRTETAVAVPVWAEEAGTSPVVDGWLFVAFFLPLRAGGGAAERAVIIPSSRSGGVGIPRRIKASMADG